jgi:catechol 2,3-dioxygenase-like lactoylglutathione lyase family enzyme
MDSGGLQAKNCIMFQLPKVFHVSHVVDDLDAAVAWYRDVFSGRLWQRSELFGTAVALLVVGDVVLMPMQPTRAFPTAPGRFRERFGSRLHSLALYVDRPEALIEHPQPSKSSSTRGDA